MTRRRGEARRDRSEKRSEGSWSPEAHSPGAFA